MKKYEKGLAWCSLERKWVKPFMRNKVKYCPSCGSKVRTRRRNKRDISGYYVWNPLILAQWRDYLASRNGRV